MKTYNFNCLLGAIRRIVVVHATSLNEAVDQVDDRYEICSVCVDDGRAHSRYTPV